MSPKEKNPLAFFHEEPISDRDYTMSEAVAEAKRCLNCRVPQCRNGCPIENEIPQFIHEVAQEILARLPNIFITAVISHTVRPYLPQRNTM